MFGLTEIGKAVFAGLCGLCLCVFSAAAQVEGLEEPVDQEDELSFETDPAAPASSFSRPWERAFFIRRDDTDEMEKLTFGGGAVTGANGLEIFVFNLGQADSALIVGPGPARKTLLIDLGKSSSPGKTGRWSYEHVGQRIYDLTGRLAVDYALISHFHKDHMGTGDYGLLGLMDKSEPGFEIGTLLDTGHMGRDFLSKRKQDNLTKFDKRVAVWLARGQLGARVQPEFGTGQIDLGGDVRVEIITFAGQTHTGHQGVHADYEADHPGHYKAKSANENDLSIGLKISVRDFEFWTAGDLSGAGGHGRYPLSGSGRAYTNVEWPLTEYLRAQNLESDVEIYRANHHGSKHSTSAPLLEALDPEFVLYSAGEASYNHPAASVVKKVEATARQFTTDMDDDAWPRPSDFGRYRGQVAGEIHIMVSPDGRLYDIEGLERRSYSDVDEAEDLDAGGEDRHVAFLTRSGGAAARSHITPNLSIAQAKAFYEALTGQPAE